MYTGPLVEYQMGGWLQVDIMVEKATSLAWCPIGAAIRRDGYAPPGKLLVDEAAGHAIAGNVASNVCCADCTNRVCGVSELAAKRHDWPTSADCYEAHMRALGLVKEPEPVPEPEDENDLQDAH